MRIMHHILFVLQDQEDQQDQTVSLSIHTYHFNLIKTNLHLYVHHRYQSLTTLQLSQVRAIAVFLVFRLLTHFVCLLTYEFCLSLWKIARCLVILLLPVLIRVSCCSLALLSVMLHLKRNDPFYWCSMYLCVTGIDFASFYDFDI